jgi:hypothetical protein
MPLHFVKGQKGQDLLLVDGFLFTKDGKENAQGIQTWRCLQYQKNRCYARVSSTRTGEVLYRNPNSKNGQHYNHAPDAADLEARQIKDSIKTKALTTQETAHNIVSTALQTASEASVSRLPLKEHLQRTVRMHRIKVSQAPALPATMEELEFPDSYKIDAHGRPFLQFDSGPSDEARLVIFASPRQLEVLQEQHSWFADGTFKTCPHLFHQVSDFV